MKKLLIAASVLTCLFSSAAFAAQAPTTAQEQAEAQVEAQQALSSAQQTSPLTRAQVEHQLAVAQKDGELSYLNTFVYQGS